MCHLFFKLNDERQVKFLEKYLHLNICIFHEQYIKNSHTCKESGAHLRIYFWHFLINLNNNYLLKNCWSGPIKNVRVLIFKMLYFKKKKKNTWRYNYFLPVYQQSWRYDLQFEIGVWRTEIGNFVSFFALSPTKTPEKLEFWKNKKKYRRYHVTHVYQKPRWYDEWILKYKVTQTDFFVILSHFLPFYPLTTCKIKILKKWNTHLGIRSFYVCVPKIMFKWCIVFWDTECNRQKILSVWAFTPLTIWKIKIFKKWKNYLEISSFYTWVPHVNHFTDCILYCSQVMVLDVCFFFILGYFCPFALLAAQKIKIFWKWKHLEVS